MRQRKEFHITAEKHIIPILYIGTNEALGRCQVFVPTKGKGFIDEHQADVKKDGEQAD